MRGTKRWQWAVPAGLLLGCWMLVSGRGVMSKEPLGPAAIGSVTTSRTPDAGASRGDAVAGGHAGTGPVEVIFPPDRAVVLSGTFDLLAKADSGSLEVNGQRQPWEAFRPPLRVAHLRLSAGMNRIRIGRRQVDLFFARYPGDEDIPHGWATYQWHPVEDDSSKRCGDCHEQNAVDGQVEVGPWKGHKSCLDCHDVVKFESIHRHPLEPLEPCLMCHAVHGSSEKGLLKAPAKNLCAECHKS
jgi:predicted CXXCH cytochrome family protein